MQKKFTSHWYSALLFPAVLLYYEVVFRLATVHGLFQLSTVFMVLLCAAYGMAGCLLTTISGSGKRNHIIAVCLTAITAVPFLVEYFVFRQFNIFYDLNTIFGGAADAVTGFTGDMFSLLLSWNGILMIVLFLLPTVLLLIFGSRFVPIGRATARKRILAVVLLIVLLGGTRAGLLLNKPLNLLWTSQYNYQSAVSHFGLLTGIGLDLWDNLSGADSNFEAASFPVVTTAPTETAAAPEETQAPSQPEATESTEATEPPVVYVPNQMDIDFASLEASGTIAELNAYVSTLTPSMTNEYTGLFEGKNLIFITAEAFCAEAIDPELTPTLYRMATQGIRFTDYYQPSGAGTTGGEYQSVFGMLPTNGGISFKNTSDNLNYFTIGNQLNRLGYWGKAYHNNDYTFYDRNLTHNNLGYSDGFLGYGNGMEEYLTSQYPTSDLEMFMGTLPDYIRKQPFNVYYMTFSGHSSYYVNCHAQVAQHFHRVEHLEQYSRVVRGYLAAQLELEDSMAYLLEQLEAAGILDDTVICVTGDHFPYGLDDDAALGSLPYLSELYGYNVTTALNRDHSALILWSGCLEDMEPIVVDSPTSSLDILPTLSNLFGTEYDSRLLPGRDALSDTEALVFNMSYDWKTDYGTYYSSTGTFVPSRTDIAISEDYVDTISAIVRNKVRYCEGVLDTDYFRYLFGED